MFKCEAPAFASKVTASIAKNGKQNPKTFFLRIKKIKMEIPVMCELYFRIKVNIMLLQNIHNKNIEYSPMESAMDCAVPTMRLAKN